MAGGTPARPCADVHVRRSGVSSKHLGTRVESCYLVRRRPVRLLCWLLVFRLGELARA